MKTHTRKLFSVAVALVLLCCYSMRRLHGDLPVIESSP
jgi:hypothetical protein